MPAWMIFTNPMTLSFSSYIWLLGPLCLSISVIYKTLHTHDLRKLPSEIIGNLLSVLAGLAALAAVLWALQRFFL